jgi:hypothetical protein
MNVETIVLIITGVITGASIILKAIMPFTKNKIDDKIYELLVKLLRLFSLDSNYSKYGNSELVK